MIDALYRWARRLDRLRPIAWVAFALSAAAFILALVGAMPGHRSLVPGIFGMTWALLFYAFVAGFSAAPPAASNDAGFFRRLGRSVHRGAFLVVGIVLLTTTAALAWLSVKLLLAG